VAYKVTLLPLIIISIYFDKKQLAKGTDRVRDVALGQVLTCMVVTKMTALWNTVALCNHWSMPSGSLSSIQTTHAQNGHHFIPTVLIYLFLLPTRALFTTPQRMNS
jgi:hypothetical protein